MATETNVKKLNIHKLKKKTYNTLAEKPAGDIFLLTDVGGQVKEITEASADYVGEIVQYVGATNDTYTNGYFYKCTETDGVYSWVQVNVQEGGLEVSEYGGDSLVAGFTYDKYMHKTTAFGKKITLPVNTSTNALFGSEINMVGAGSVGFGYNITGGSTNNTVVGSATLAYNVTNSVIIGQHSAMDPISESRSVIFASYNNAYKILDLTDGTIPAERMSATAGTTGQVLTKTDAGMEWQDATGGGELPDNVLVNNSPLGSALSVGKNSNADSFGVAVGETAKTVSTGSIAIGYGSDGKGTGIAIGMYAKTDLYSNCAIQLGFNATNSDSNTFKVANKNGNFEMMSADGTIPTDRYTTTPTDAGIYVPKLTIAEDGTATREWGTESGGAGGDYLPLSGGTLTGPLSINLGETTEQYSNETLLTFTLKRPSGETKTVVVKQTSVGLDFGGAFFTQAGDIIPATVSNTLGSYSSIWDKVHAKKICNGADLIVPTEGGTLARLEDIQIAGGLPDQTDNAGKFLTTDGTTASWSDKPLVNNSTQTNSIAIGSDSSARGDYSVTIGRYANLSNSKRSVAVGYNAGSVGSDAISIGYQAQATGAGSIQLGSLGANKLAQNNDANTFKVANANGNFELMDANGNVPLERLTYVTDQIGDISTALTAILGE